MFHTCIGSKENDEWKFFQKKISRIYRFIFRNPGKEVRIKRKYIHETCIVFCVFIQWIMLFYLSCGNFYENGKKNFFYLKKDLCCLHSGEGELIFFSTLGLSPRALQIKKKQLKPGLEIWDLARRKV